LTPQIHMLRGDWLLEALTAIHRNQARWEPLPTTPSFVTPQSKGRFHWDTQTWWTDAGEKSSNPPLAMHVYSPPEKRIDYPGEQWLLTPTWVREVRNALEVNGTHSAFVTYAENETTGSSIAYYSDQHGRVVWGRHPKALREAALTASDHMPYTPHLKNLDP